MGKKPKAKNVAGYIAAAIPFVGFKLKAIRQAIRQAAPKADQPYLSRRWVAEIQIPADNRGELNP